MELVPQSVVLARGLGDSGCMPPRGVAYGRFCEADRQTETRIAILAPMSGSAGLWGPSCLSSAQLAVAEINERGGLKGRQLTAIFLDSDDGQVDVLERELPDLIESEAICGVIAMSVSSVRQRVVRSIAGRIPHIYTPLFEGNERSPNVFTIGETPRDQLLPAIHRLTRNLGVRRWALIGNDYVWPKTSHAIAKACIGQCGGEVVFEAYVPFGIENPCWLVERVMATRPDIVIVSLVGQDAVEFNRAFGAQGRDRHVFRFSTAIEENVLLASGAENTKRLFASASYFAALATQRNLSFKERYHAMHGENAPALNSLGQSMYEGVSFFAALACRQEASSGPIVYPSARGGVFYSNDRKENPTYLARADGHRFHILDALT